MVKKMSFVQKLRKEWRDSQPFPKGAVVEYRTPKQRVNRLLELFDKFYEESDKSSRAPGKIVTRMKEHFRSLFVSGQANGLERHVPGVEVGQRFQFRAQLVLLGLHRLPQTGIDWKEIDWSHQKAIIAMSVVYESGAYEDDVDEGETLIYTGEGGRNTGSRKQVQDQKLEKGNEALYNNIRMEERHEERPVRVIRAYGKRGSGKRSAANRYYSYDGLYKVESFEYVIGKSNFKVYQFKLVRVPGQKPLQWSAANVATRETRKGFASSGEKKVRLESEESEDSISSEEGEDESEESDDLISSEEGEDESEESDYLISSEDEKDLPEVERAGTSIRQETSVKEASEETGKNYSEMERDGDDATKECKEEADNLDNGTVDSTEGSVEYEVDCIIDKRTVGRRKSRRVEYRVHWKGYSSNEDTWEPESHLGNCPEKLAEFKKASK